MGSSRYAPVVRRCSPMRSAGRNGNWRRGQKAWRCAKRRGRRRSWWSGSRGDPGPADNLSLPRYSVGVPGEGKFHTTTLLVDEILLAYLPELRQRLFPRGRDLRRIVRLLQGIEGRVVPQHLSHAGDLELVAEEFLQVPRDG